MTTATINGTTYTVTRNPDNVGRVGEYHLTGSRGARYSSVPNYNYPGLFHFIRFTRGSLATMWDGELFTVDGDTIRPASVKDVR